MKSAFGCIALAAFLVACPAPSPQPPPAPIVDAGPELLDAAAPCAKACSNLASLGCAEGVADNCSATCSRAQGVVTDLHPACLASAKTKAEARACKSVRCP